MTNKFGVEIECFSSGYFSNMSTFLRENNLSNYFTYHGDCSIHPPKYSDCTYEIVSHPLPFEQKSFDAITRLTTLLKEKNFNVNKSCGLHVHVDASDLNAGNVASILYRYNIHDREIGKIMLPSRNRNKFCKKISGVDWTSNRIGDLLYDRFYRVNPKAYYRHGTVEFRHHHGTLDDKEINNWVLFCKNMMDISKNNSISDIPKETMEVDLLDIRNRAKINSCINILKTCFAHKTDIRSANRICGHNYRYYEQTIEPILYAAGVSPMRFFGMAHEKEYVSSTIKKLNDFYDKIKMANNIQCDLSKLDIFDGLNEESKIYFKQKKVLG